MADWQQRLDSIIGAAVDRSQQIESIVIGANAIAQVPDLLSAHFAGRPALLIADGNTMAAAGERLAVLLESANIKTRSQVFPGKPPLKPTMENAEAIRSAIVSADAVPVAVGAGVINDMVKYAAYKSGRRYACVATAASMDGYASASAPLIDRGFKLTTPCPPPSLIVGDLDVISAAPSEMAGWGFGDLAGKVPAAADWILADAMAVEPIDDVAWPLVQDNVRDWLSTISAAPAGDHEAAALLFGGLVATGLAMEFYGSSRPASGADHLLAHVWEMEGLTHEGQPVSHGSMVATGTITVLALYEWLMAQDLTRLEVDELAAAAPSKDGIEAEIAALFDNPVVAARAVEESALKPSAPEEVRKRLSWLQSGWPSLQPRLERNLMPAAEMARWLSSAGVASKAGDIGVSADHHRRTIERARFIRRRYTILDLLTETRLLDRALDAQFSAGGMLAGGALDGAVSRPAPAS